MGISVKALRLMGKNLFHVKYINLSYRMRGNVHRIHTNVIARIIVLRIIHESESISSRMGCPVKNTIDRSLIIKMFVYSAMKIMANIPLLYSVLNPETSSDSPSAKSNGVRLVSARFVINQIINNGRIITIIQDLVFMLMLFISII